MDVVHQWYTCCVYPGEGDPAVTDWDIAVLPVGPDGKITSKLHADTIGIMDSTENPEAAFEALSFLAASPELIQTWGAMPAVESQRAAVLRRARGALRAARDRLERLVADAPVPRQSQP